MSYPRRTQALHVKEILKPRLNSSKEAVLFSEEKEVTSGQIKNSSSNRPISAWLGPVPLSKGDRCSDLSRVEKSLSRKDDLQI